MAGTTMRGSRSRASPFPPTGRSGIWWLLCGNAQQVV